MIGQLSADKNLLLSDYNITKDMLKIDVKPAQYEISAVSCQLTECLPHQHHPGLFLQGIPSLCSLNGSIYVAVETCPYLLMIEEGCTKVQLRVLNVQIPMPVASIHPLELQL